MNMKIGRVVTLLLIAFILSSSSKKVLAQEPAILPSPTIAQNIYEEQYKFLRDEAIRFENNMRDERHAFYAFVGVVLTVVGIAGVSGVLSIKQESKAAFKQEIESERNELKNKINGWAEEKLYDQFGLNKRIVILADKKRQKELLKEEIEILNKRGFNDIELKQPDVNIDNADLIIFCFNDDLHDDLNKVIDILESTSKKVPLIGYYHTSFQNERLNKYKYRAFANSPITLASWVFTISSSFKT